MSRSRVLLPPAHLRLRIARMSIAFVCIVALVIGTHQPGLTAAASIRNDPDIELRKDKSVPGENAVPQSGPADATRDHVIRTSVVRWPKPGGAEISVPVQDRGNLERAKAGDLPVWVAPASIDAKVTAAAPSKVRVEVTGRRDDALLLSVARADGAATPGRIVLGVDYSAFRDAYGGDWASRLHLATEPACATTTPSAPNCRRTPLRTVNNGSGQLSAEVPVSGRPTTLVVTAGASSGAGDYNNSALSDGGATWSVGGSSGDFEWSLPMDVVPGLGGPQPTIGLQYSSGSVDGLSSATNNQTSMVGQGFELSASGSIERRYKSCGKDRAGGNNANRTTGDLCFAGDSMTMSLNGSAGSLVFVSRDTAGNEVWRTRGDDGSIVEKLTGADNGDGGLIAAHRGEYWRMTAPDGTRYFFGLHKLPGWTSGVPTTNSAWTAPVFGNHAGEQCHTSSFASSWCQQAYRWNLDYVVDRHGNTQSLHYDTETGRYARNLTATAVSPYVRAGNLKRIEYGQRDGQVYTQRAVGQVLFTTAERCTPQPCGPGQPLTYPDTPWDLNCASTTNCNNHFTPTFWTQKRLSKVTTQVWRAERSRHEDVKSWSLRHDYLRADNTGAAMWLAGVTNAGHVGTAQQLPELRFGGIALDNRVDTSSDMIPPLKWFRVNAIHYGTGGDLAVTYSGADCTATSLPQPADNNRRCRPQKWTPENQPERQDWFHKYVVTKVVQTDRTAASNAPSAPVPVVSTIEYPEPPAWRFEELDATMNVNDATWSQWRGYGKVRVIKGAPGETRSVSETLYFRGMDGDRNGSGGTKDVKITDSTGVTVDDTNEFSGQAREQQTFRDGSVVDKAISDYWMSAPTASMTRPWGTLTAHRFGQKEVVQYQAVDGGPLRTSTKHTYTADGRLESKHELNDAATAADDTCTRYEYVSNPAAGLRELPARQQTVSVGCDQTPTNAHVISDERVYFDNSTSYTAPPQRGLVTRAERLSGFGAAGQPTYETVFTAAYDAVGRQTRLTNALQQSTERIYTPALGPVTSITDVAANGHRKATRYEPAWGEPVSLTEPDGRTSEVAHDALGRPQQGWKPGHSKESDPPDVEYEYTVSGAAASVVTTKTRIDAERVDVSHELYDGLMRLRQTQEPTPAGGRLVTDHRYDSRGHQTEVNGAYFNDAPPSTQLLLVDPATLPKQEITIWDASDRPTAQIVKREGVELARTTHSVSATRQSIDPPDGQTATTRIADARGRLVELRQHTGDSPTGPYDSTRYSYDDAGRLTALTDPAGNVWRYSYDIRGRRISENDPDKGVTAFEYDDADRLISTTDARGIKLAYSYDSVGRKTALNQVAPSTQLLVQWTYDTLAAGRPTSTTRYVIEGSVRSAYTTAVTGYDAAGRPTGQSITLPAVEGRLAGIHTIRQTYSHDDEIATRTLPGIGDLPGETLNYEYNDQGLPIRMHSELGTYVRNIDYTPYDESERITLGPEDGRWVEQQFEYELGTRRLNRVVTNREMLPRRISDTSYEYDLAGNVTKVTDAPSATSGEPADTQCFDYDHLRRLTQAWTPSDEDCDTAPTAAGLGGPAPYWHKWTFDKTGNRTSEQKISTAGTITSTYEYGAPGAANPHALRRVTSTGPAGTSTKSFGYDRVGNTTTRTAGTTTENLSWDAEGRLALATKSGATTSFLYDGDGNRLIRRDASGTTVYLGENELTLRADGTLSGTRHYTMDEQVIAVRVGDRLSWLFTDLQGNPTIAVDAENQSVQRRRTTPYGEPRGAPPQNWPGQRSFAGGTADPSTGLVHLGQRQYDPTTGRFLSVDPELHPEDPQQLNGYSYANNNPASFDDSDGRVAIALVPVVGVAIVIIAVVVIVAVVILIFEQHVVPRKQTITNKVWDIFNWAWRTMVQVVTILVAITRVVFKTILQRKIEYITQMVVTIKWVKKVINQVRKPVRGKAKASPVKKPQKPVGKSQGTVKRPGNKPAKEPKKSDKARSPNKPQPRKGLSNEQREAIREFIAEVVDGELKFQRPAEYDPDKWLYNVDYPSDNSTNEFFHDMTPKIRIKKERDGLGSEFTGRLPSRRGSEMIDGGVDTLEFIKKILEFFVR